MGEPLKVIQWYTGDIGRHQMRLIAARPDLELVGAFVFHDDKVGLDAGEIAEIGPLGVRATNDLDEMLALDADCVLYNPPMERYDEIIPILASGKNVISIIAGFHPHKRSAYADIERACVDGRSSLFGTGLNPGLSYEFALLASSMCTGIERVTIKTCEPQATMSQVFLDAFGFGKTEQQVADEAMGAYGIFARTLHQVTDLVCEELGLETDGTDFTYEFEPATRDYDEKVTVKEGTMAGLLLTASTTCAGQPVASIEIRFLLGADYVRPEWLANGPRLGWLEVEVDGTPGSRLTHEVLAKEGFTSAWSTGTRAVNAVPAVCAAPPGCLSPADLPLLRAARAR